MNTKLTLTIDESIIQKAKKHARSQGRSLSDLIEQFLRIITTEENKENPEISPRVKSMKGSFKIPDEFDYKEELSKELSKKYL